MTLGVNVGVRSSACMFASPWHHIFQKREVSGKHLVMSFEMHRVQCENNAAELENLFTVKWISVYIQWMCTRVNIVTEDSIHI